MDDKRIIEGRRPVLEALFGYLYLKGEHTRLHELIDIINAWEEEN